MQIQKVIHSSDDKDYYLDFWPIVSKIWKLKFKIEPVLIHFGIKEVSTEYGTVIRPGILPNVPINVQCQLSRYWLPLTEPDTIWMTSDIDMLPISKKYFIDAISSISDDKFISMNHDIHEHHPNINYSCCYNVAKGSTFMEILKSSHIWIEFMKGDFWKNDNTNHSPNGLTEKFPHWSIDEKWSSQFINQFDRSRIVHLARDCGKHMCRRIDRDRWEWNKESILSEYYFDCHCIRPYANHKQEIDAIVEHILHDSI